MTREEIIQGLYRGDSKAIKEAVITLEQEPCEDVISRSSVFEIMGNLMSIPYDLDRPINKKDVSESMNEIRALPPVTPVACISTVKFSKEDMRELIDEKMKDIVIEHKKGKWIEDYIPLPLSDGSKKCYQCSECRTHWDNVFNYCPNCGAEMENEE